MECFSVTHNVKNLRVIHDQDVFGWMDVRACNIEIVILHQRFPVYEILYNYFPCTDCILYSIYVVPETQFLSHVTFASGLMYW